MTLITCPACPVNKYKLQTYQHYQSWFYLFSFVNRVFGTRILDCILKKKLIAILSRLNFEQTYFNCDLHIVMCYEAAERDIDNEPPPHSITEAVNSSL